MSKKVNLNSLSELKSAVDEAVIKILLKKGYKQNYKRLDVQLFIGYCSVIVAAITSAVDYIYGFQEAKIFTGWGTFFFFFLLICFNVWSSKVIKNTLFVGDSSKKSIKVYSYDSKYDPQYQLRLDVNIGTKDYSSTVNSINYTDLFRIDGTLSEESLLQFINKSLPKTD